MAKPKVYGTRAVYRTWPGFDRLAEEVDLVIWEATGDTFIAPRAAQLEAVRDAEGILCGSAGERIDRELMEAAPQLKVVSITSEGMDNVDLPEATRRGIFVCNTWGSSTETVADFAFLGLMAAARRVMDADRYVREGKWQGWVQQMAPQIRSVSGATLGILGLGAIGMEMARRGRGFDMRVLYWSRSRKPEAEQSLGIEWRQELDELLAECDFVSLHLPLNSDTRQIIDERRLGLMKPSAILINTARGELVDQQALYEALKDHRLTAAALDVIEGEPAPPLQGNPLLALDNVVLSPHVAQGSDLTTNRRAVMAVENLMAGLRGELPAVCVNPEALAVRQAMA